MSFIFSELIYGVRRSASMVFSVVIVTFISLTFVGAAALMQLQITHMKSFWYDRAQVAIFLCTEHSSQPTCAAGTATEDQKENVRKRLESPVIKPLIDRYYFENREQAYKNFKEQFKNNKIVELATPDQLNETFWVKLRNPSQSLVIIEAFSGLTGVDSVIDQRQYLNQIFNILNLASLTSIAIAVIMLISAAMLIATTIRLSAFTRRKEIEIMRLVGASNSFVQAPFILEGIFAASIGAFLSSLAIISIVQFFIADYLAVRLPFVSFISLGESLIIIPLLFGIALLLSGLSAKFSISRSLRV